MQLARYPKLNQSDFPCGKIICCTDHAELLVGYHLRQNRSCLFQSFYIMAYIRDNRALLKIRTGLLHFPFNTRFHGPHQISDVPTRAELERHARREESLRVQRTLATATDGWDLLANNNHT
jgi:hypothetical protein